MFRICLLESAKLRSLFPSKGTHTDVGFSILRRISDGESYSYKSGNDDGDKLVMCTVQLRCRNGGELLRWRALIFVCNYTVSQSVSQVIRKLYHIAKESREHGWATDTLNCKRTCRFGSSSERLLVLPWYRLVQYVLRRKLHATANKRS